MNDDNDKMEEDGDGILRSRDLPGWIPLVLGLGFSKGENYYNSEHFSEGRRERSPTSTPECASLVRGTRTLYTIGSHLPGIYMVVHIQNPLAPYEYHVIPDRPPLYPCNFVNIASRIYILRVIPRCTI